MQKTQGNTLVELPAVSKGFTLVELLVVIGIIVILVGILIPSVESAMASAQRTKCLTNLKALSTAWRTYATDHNGILVGPGTWPVIGSTHDWVYRDDGTYKVGMVWSGSDDTLGRMYVTEGGGWYGWNSTTGSASVGDAAEEKNDPALKEPAITSRPFYKYTGSLAMYKCTQDPRSNYLRSYSLNHCLGESGGPPSVLNLGEVSNSSGTLLFTEEHDPRGYNVGSWLAGDWRGADKDKWVDPIADYHQHSANLTFADGHGENYAFKDERTNNMKDGGATHPGSEDLLFYQRAFRSQ